MMEHKYVLGNVDYNGSRQKNCEAVIEWRLEDGKFSMSADIWNPRKTDILTGGQCVDEVVSYFPKDKIAKRMLAIWEKYHLNNMRAGSPRQEAWVLANRALVGNFSDSFSLIKKGLAEAGLDPDAEFLYKGEPYRYGSAWLKEELPDDIIAEISSWSDLKKAKTNDSFKDWLASEYLFSAQYVGETLRGDHYRCTFSTKSTKEEKKRDLTLDYYQGVAYRKTPTGKTYNPRYDTGYQLGFSFSPNRSAPTAKRVMTAAVQDAQAYSDNKDMADFIEMFGYEDLREGRRVWQACETQYSNLQAFARENFRKLMNEEETFKDELSSAAEESDQC